MLVISGKSATGKDTVVTELVNNYDYNKLITYTTRPMREGERDGIDYHFITVEDFLKKYIDGFFLEVKYFTTQSGIWFYGSSIEDYREADDKTLVILTPDGVRKLSERNIPYKGFLIDISDEEIKRRQKLRGDMSTPEKAAEAERRFKQDKIDFDSMHNYELYNFKVGDDDITPQELAKHIHILDTEVK